ncbi:hypothetical protein [Roseivivax isoporae]|uniref:Uncharacterized protein n=1 Tax=Roseivivax isoporae LMG 25204 TaxID=1449351 RepID=X7FBF3_9RHOB|nr:hypothetical protein [Roseivivax isoporae]ETX30242.1 hypothetical protein RISW2_15520 [Roseivivax isoporae LMG 25204]
MRVPVLEHIVRQHAEEAAHLWVVYDWHLLHPDENPDMDAERMDRLIDRLDAHLDGLRIAGADGIRIAQDRYDDFPEAGELFVLRMLQPGAARMRVRDLDLAQVRDYLAAKLPDPLG